ncbi:MAG: FIST N-terminal domain-containing protein [Planctomycetota bacterium]
MDGAVSVWCRGAVGCGDALGVADSLAAGHGSEGTQDAADEGGVGLLFASGAAGGKKLAELSHTVKRAARLDRCVGVSVSGVVSGARSHEGIDAVSLLVIRGVSGEVVRVDTLPKPAASEPTDNERAAMSKASRVTERTAFSVLLTDPTSSPLVRLLPAVSSSRALGSGPLIGGLASGTSVGSGDAVVLDGDPVGSGVLVNVEGPVSVDASISQGARAVGEPMVVTRSRENVVLELGGRRAIDRVRETLETLPAADRKLFTSGLLLGLVVDEYRPRFGREDFLIRPVLGLDQASGAVAIGDRVRTGQTVQFHLRDAAAASDDLSMMLEVQRLRGADPLGALVVTCGARGGEFFEVPNHDSSMVARAIAERSSMSAEEDPGEERAKAGVRIEPVPSAPMAGFFAGGEIGPVSSGGMSSLHTHSAVVAMIRRAEDERG